MKILNRTYRAVPFLLLVVGMFVSVLPASGHVAHKHPAAPAPPSARQFEIKFLKGMIDHHAMAVHMARACSTRADHPELKQLCEQIKTAQQEEIAQMQSWLHSWYWITHHPHMMPGDMSQMARMESMTGSTFEIAFLEMMIKHHSMAVRDAGQCARRASHPDLKRFCHDIHKAQEAEIAQMKGWLCQWYQKCR